MTCPLNWTCLVSVVSVSLGYVEVAVMQDLCMLMFMSGCLESFWTVPEGGFQPVAMNVPQGRL